MKACDYPAKAHFERQLKAQNNFDTSRQFNGLASARAEGCNVLIQGGFAQKSRITATQWANVTRGKCEF